MHMLGAHPAEQEKVRKEVTEVVGNNLPTFEVLSRLEYTEKFIKETMRLEPATGFVPTRRCIADTVIGGVSVPSGVRRGPLLYNAVPDQLSTDPRCLRSLLDPSIA